MEIPRPLTESAIQSQLAEDEKMEQRDLADLLASSEGRVVAAEWRVKMEFHQDQHTDLLRRDISQTVVHHPRPGQMLRPLGKAVGMVSQTIEMLMDSLQVKTHTLIATCGRSSLLESLDLRIISTTAH